MSNHPNAITNVMSSIIKLLSLNSYPRDQGMRKIRKYDLKEERKATVTNNEKMSAKDGNNFDNGSERTNKQSNTTRHNDTTTTL